MERKLERILEHIYVSGVKNSQLACSYVAQRYPYCHFYTGNQKDSCLASYRVQEILMRHHFLILTPQSHLDLNATAELRFSEVSNVDVGEKLES